MKLEYTIFCLVLFIIDLQVGMCHNKKTVTLGSKLTLGSKVIVPPPLMNFVNRGQVI